MKKTKLLLCSLLVLCAVLFSMTAFAADDLVFTFENENSLAGWSTSFLRYNFDPGYFNGYAFEKPKAASGAAGRTAGPGLCSQCGSS